MSWLPFLLRSHRAHAPGPGADLQAHSARARTRGTIRKDDPAFMGVHLSLVANRQKEKATVPLFFAQTLISSMRDVGYNHTTSALCEHVDNAIQAKATEIRVYFIRSLPPCCNCARIEP